ncbi:MAG: type II toxin-antitoxin system VapC family toxin [Pseudomonadota bacterium]|nr:type II toxin-antitoxin system VapC family toxin [Pseudomonadota bacterium]MDP2351329.1 type II toxin-antitoxin system VapC family toxin [Pseudomonadota bacterium]
MSTVVVDASTLLKWVLPESGEEYLAQANAIAASALSGRLRLLVPSLWYYEAGNILARKIPDQAGAAMDHLVSLLTPWTRPPTPDTQALALELVRRHGVTFYDASYHALAIVGGGMLVTADARYVRKVGASESLMALADWALA